MERDRIWRELAAYAGQFPEMMQKPDVDLIDGLSPAISIERKTKSRSPRSTVGTVTEICDYMRFLQHGLDLEKVLRRKHESPISSGR